MNRNNYRLFVFFIIISIGGFCNTDFVLANNEYIVTELEIFGGVIKPNDINNKGQVVGWGRNNASEDIAYIWTKTGGMVDLGNLGAKYRNGAKSINNLGQVVGFSRTNTGQIHAFLWSIEDEMMDLFPIATNIDGAHIAISDIGWIASSNHNYNGRPEAFLWTEDNGINRLGIGGRTNGYSYPEDINNMGQIVGTFQSAVSTPRPNTYPDRAFIWQESTGLQDIGHLGGYFSRAFAINEYGAVVGWSAENFRYSTNSYGYDSHAFLWTQENGMLSIEDVVCEGSIAKDINNHGQVIGRIWYGDTVQTPSGSTHYVSHAFIWTEEQGMIDLGTFGAESIHPEAINDRGQIVASATIFSEGKMEHHVFLLTPIPTLDDILNFFDESVENGTLEGDGRGNSANGKLNALRNMLEMAADLIEIDDIEGACGQLKAAQKKCDGETRPPDFVTGDAGSELADMILTLMEELGCE